MDLLRNYPEGYNVLPTANPHDVVNVSLQLALYHLVDMVGLGSILYLQTLVMFRTREHRP